MTAVVIQFPLKVRPPTPHSADKCWAVLDQLNRMREDGGLPPLGRTAWLETLDDAFGESWREKA